MCSIFASGGGAVVFGIRWFRPYPVAGCDGSEWLLLPYLLAADVQNTVLSALLTFAAKPLYPQFIGDAADQRSFGRGGSIAGRRHYVG